MNSSQLRQINSAAFGLLEHGWTVRLVTTSRAGETPLPTPHLVASAQCSRPTEYVIAPAPEPHQLQVWSSRDQQLHRLGRAFDAEEAHEVLSLDVTTGQHVVRPWPVSA